MVLAVLFSRIQLINGMKMAIGQQYKILASAIMVVGLAMPVQASIIDHGDFLTDTETGLDWLDVTKSVNRSYDDVSSEVGAGGDFSGWRYANGQEFNTLVGNFTGATIATFGYVIQETSLTSPIDGLVILLGSTLDSWYMSLFNKTLDEYYNSPEGSVADATYGLIADRSTEYPNEGQQWVALMALYEIQWVPHS